MITAEHIARTAHAINRAYCASIGDNSQPAWEDAPEWQRSSAINGVNMHLANPNATPEDSHKSWLAQKEAEGWVYGPEKNPDLKTHPCMLPYDQLPVEQRVKDHLFKQTVRSLADLDQELIAELFKEPAQNAMDPAAETEHKVTPGTIATLLRENVACSQVMQNKVAMQNLAESLENEQVHLDAANEQA